MFADVMRERMDEVMRTDAKTFKIKGEPQDCMNAEKTLQVCFESGELNTLKTGA